MHGTVCVSISWQFAAEGEVMLKLLMMSVCCFLCSAQTQAEMSISSVDPESGRKSSASASIVIRVHIPVRTTLKLSSDAQQVSSETNLQNNSGLIISCNTQQGFAIAQCTRQQTGQIFTLTTL